MRDLSVRHSVSPSAPDVACPARHTSDHPSQHTLRRGSPRILCICIFNIVVNVAEGRRTFRTAMIIRRLQRVRDTLPLGLTSSP